MFDGILIFLYIAVPVYFGLLMFHYIRLFSRRWAMKRLALKFGLSFRKTPIPFSLTFGPLEGKRNYMSGSINGHKVYIYDVVKAFPPSRYYINEDTNYTIINFDNKSETVQTLFNCFLPKIKKIEKKIEVLLKEEVKKITPLEKRQIEFMSRFFNFIIKLNGGGRVSVITRLLAGVIFLVGAWLFWLSVRGDTYICHDFICFYLNDMAGWENTGIFASIHKVLYAVSPLIGIGLAFIFSIFSTRGAILILLGMFYPYGGYNYLPANFFDGPIIYGILQTAGYVLFIAGILYGTIEGVIKLLKINKKYMNKIILILVAVIIVVVAGFFGYKYLNGNKVIFENRAGWGPCDLETHFCSVKTKLYNSGKLVYTQFGKGTKIVNGTVVENETITNKEINDSSIMETILEKLEEIMDKDCDTQVQVLDFGQTTTITLEGKTKRITYPGCKTELETITDLFPAIESE